VRIGAGAMWIDAYTAVTTKAGLYVQGGGCTTVGVPGLVQGGGFGSFSKRYGTAAASLLEAEVVTADGQVRIANAHTNPDLFWAIKGGGGGTFGVVTRMTLRTHELPDYFGGVFGDITAASDEAFKALVARFVAFYHERLFNPHWGETVSLREGRQLHLSMVFQGLDRAQAQAVWAPFLDWVRASGDYTFKEPTIMAVPARRFWDAGFWEKAAPGLMVKDEREGAAPHHAVWAGDRDRSGWTIHGYESTWLPAGLLEEGAQAAWWTACAPLRSSGTSTCTSTRACTAHRRKPWRGSQYGHPSRRADAFALVIIAGGGDMAYPGSRMRRVDEAGARRRVGAIRSAMDTLRKVAPNAGAYVSESDFFQQRWQDTYWGPNYPKLLKIKQRYDPDGLFTVRHGVGSEAWSADGFTRRAEPCA
jgi:FAD/FMN-containing dehydrogenase